MNEVIKNSIEQMECNLIDFAVPVVKEILGIELEDRELSVIKASDYSIWFEDITRKQDSYRELYCVRYLGGEATDYNLVLIVEKFVEKNGRKELINARGEYLFPSRVPRPKLNIETDIWNNTIKYVLDVETNDYELDVIIDKKLWIMIPHKIYEDLCSVLDDVTIRLDWVMNHFAALRFETRKLLEEKQVVSGEIIYFVEDSIIRAFGKFIYDFSGNRVTD